MSRSNSLNVIFPTYRNWLGLGARPMLDPKVERCEHNTSLWNSYRKRELASISIQHMKCPDIRRHKYRAKLSSRPYLWTICRNDYLLFTNVLRSTFHVDFLRIVQVLHAVHTGKGHVATRLCIHSPVVQTCHTCGVGACSPVAF